MFGLLRRRCHQCAPTLLQARPTGGGSSHGGRRTVWSELNGDEKGGGGEDGAVSGDVASSLLSKDPGLKCTTFERWMAKKRESAKRSMLVQVKSEDSGQDLLNYCSHRFGHVKAMHYHRNVTNKDFPSFYMVEFSSPDSRLLAMQGSTHSLSNDINPVCSPLMWFGGQNTRNLPQSQSPIFVPTAAQLDKSEASLENELMQHDSMEDQVLALYKFYRMSTLDTKLRFFACEQLELATSGIFPQARFVPFGSSVNLFGKHDTDLDMIFDLTSSWEMDPESRLVFHTKCDVGRARYRTVKHLDHLSNLVEHFLPGCQEVQRIFNARVPICSYRQGFVGLDCDVSLDKSGMYMSELLYLYGELDVRVRPLVFTIRHWASQMGLLKKGLSDCFKSFQITLMVLFFLQFKYNMLPPFNRLKKLARPEDKRAREGTTKFLRDISGLQPHLNKEWFSQSHILRDSSYDDDEGVNKSQQAEPLTLVQMLTDFFEFYAEFDFDRLGICLTKGTTFEVRSRRGHAGGANLFVINPFFSDKNTTDNVKPHTVRYFQTCCADSLRKMAVLSQLPEDQLKNSKLSYLLGMNAEDDLSKIIASATTAMASSSSSPSKKSGKSKPKSSGALMDRVLDDVEGSGEVEGSSSASSSNSSSNSSSAFTAAATRVAAEASTLSASRSTDEVNIDAAAEANEQQQQLPQHQQQHHHHQPQQQPLGVKKKQGFKGLGFGERREQVQNNKKALKTAQRGRNPFLADVKQLLD